MSVLVESLRRLYLAGRLTKKKIMSMKSINDEEKDYIINGESDV